MPAPSVLPWPVSQHTLNNGLRIVVCEDRSAPTVAVSLWYNVGSRHELPGRHGFAHFFEHMMFEDSAHSESGAYAKLVQECGGSFNADTGADRTRYYPTVPAEHLARVLWLEADRMGALNITQESVDKQRAIIKNERRQNLDTPAYGNASELFFELAYPAGHPYDHHPMGSMAELDAATVADFAAFHRAYYAPDNAVLAVVGDTDITEVVALATTYFGRLKPRGTVPARTVEALPRHIGRTVRHTVAEKKTKTARLYLLHRIPAWTDPDHLAVRLLTTALADGRGSRLRRALVEELEVALPASDFLDPWEGAYEASFIRGWVSPRGETTLEELESAYVSALESVADTPFSDAELDRAKARLSADVLRGLESFDGRAHSLSMHVMLHGDLDRLYGSLAAIDALTSADLCRVAAETFRADNRVVISYPAGIEADIEAGIEEDAEAAPPIEIPETAPTTDDAAAFAEASALLVAELPGVGTPRAFRFPEVRDLSLAGGRVVAAHVPGALAQIQLVLPGGKEQDPAGKDGLAGVTSGLLPRGTQLRSADAYALAVDSLGARETGGGTGHTTCRGLNLPVDRIMAGAELLAESARRPALADAEISAAVARAVASAEVNARNPMMQAGQAFNEALFGAGARVGRPPAGTPETLGAITAEDVRAFHAEHFTVPGTLVVTGDLTLIDLEALAKVVFAGVEGVERVAAAGVEREAPASGGRVITLDQPGSPQSLIVFGHRLPGRGDPDVEPFHLVNKVLGSGPTSRLITRMREEKAYTYGVSTMASFERDYGSLLGVAPVETRATAEAVADLLDVLREVAEDGIGAEELETFRTATLNAMAGGVVGAARIGMKLADAVQYGLPHDEPLRRYRQIAALSSADVNAAAKRNLRPEDLLIVVQGDMAVVKPLLDAAGVAYEG